MNNSDYIRMSLELHLFFDRIMKEHSLFLEATFLDKNNNFKQTAKNFQNSFSNILKKVIALSNGNISESIISTHEMVTKNTLNAENKTSNLLGIPIDTNITQSEFTLRSGTPIVNNQLLTAVSSINRETLPLIRNLINFKIF